MYPSKILSDKLQSISFIADTVGTLSKCPHWRESLIAGLYFSQTSIVYFAGGLAVVRIIGVSVIVGCPQGER